MPSAVPPPRPGQPAIIAHRGVPRLLPENTLAGFARALDEGADGIELDVHLTADGQVVVHHDDALRDGAAGAGGGLRLAEHSLAVLRGRSAVELPTLAEVLELVGLRARVHVELKGPRLEGAVIEVLRGGHSRCAVHAFDHRAIHRAALLAPEVPRGVLLVSRVVDPVAVLRTASATTLWQEWTLIDEQLVDEVHAAGGSVVAWTVNDVGAARNLARMDVDAICTDWPGRLRAALHGHD